MTSRQIAQSVADIVDHWATNNQNPTIDSVIIITQFSSRIRKPIYEKTAEEFEKDELINLLTQTIVIPDYGSQADFKIEYHILCSFGQNFDV